MGKVFRAHDTVLHRDGAIKRPPTTQNTRVPPRFEGKPTCLTKTTQHQHPQPQRGRRRFQLR
jgi:hypothetical protein